MEGMGATQELRRDGFGYRAACLPDYPHLPATVVLIEFKNPKES